MKNPSTTHHTNYYFRLVFGACCISFAAIFVKLLGRDLMGPTLIAFWRTFLGFIIFFIWAIVSRKSLRLDIHLLKWLALAGFIFFLDLFCWHRSVLYCGAGMATVLGNTQVFGTAILSLLFFKEKLTTRFFIASAAAILGVFLLIGVMANVEFTTTYLKGIFYGLMTGLFYSGYLVTMKFAGGYNENKGKTEKINFIVLMGWTSLFSALSLAPVSYVEETTMIPATWYVFGVVLALALVCQVIGWWSISGALPKVKGSQAGLILLLQPTLATVWGVVFFNEQLDISQIAGAVITLGAIYYGSVRNSSEA